MCNNYSITAIKIHHVVWDALMLHPEPYVEKQHMQHVNAKLDAQGQPPRVLGHHQLLTVLLVLNEDDADAEDACHTVRLKECRVACVTSVCIVLLFPFLTLSRSSESFCLRVSERKSDA